MTGDPTAPATTPWARDRRPRWGWAAAVAALLVVLAGGLAPVEWLRAVFGRQFGALVVTSVDRVEPLEGIRLIPVPQRARSAAESAPPQVAAPSLRSDPSEETVETLDPDPTFVWDPTTAFAPAAELLAPAAPDSIMRRATLLEAMAFGRVERSFALFDTTQVTAARRRFQWMDRYMNDVMRPLLEAEGDAARRAAIYYRAVGEVEEEGDM